MTYTKLLTMIVFLGIQLFNVAFAEIYKCKTVAGKTIYTSNKCAETADIFIPRQQSNLIAAKNTDSVENNGNIPTVDIYITSWCPYCKKAMAYLDSNNIPFTAHDIEKDAQAKAEKHKLAPDYSGVPLTVINGIILKGFSESNFQQALLQ